MEKALTTLRARAAEGRFISRDGIREATLRALEERGLIELEVTLSHVESWTSTGLRKRPCAEFKVKNVKG